MVKNLLQCGRPGFDPWVMKSPWRREWLPTPVSCLENPIDRGAWWATVMGLQWVRHDWATNIHSKLSGNTGKSLLSNALHAQKQSMCTNSPCHRIHAFLLIYGTLLYCFYYVFLVSFLQRPQRRLRFMRWTRVKGGEIGLSDTALTAE